MGVAKDETTVVIPRKLKGELDSLKEYDRETYAHVIQTLVARVKNDDESKMELSEETKKKLARAEEDFKKGRFYTTSELKKKLGI